MPKTRKINVRKPNRRIFILCEGEKTEPNYFNGLIRHCRFPGKLVEVKVIPFKKNTPREVVNEAKKYKELKSDESWVVIDKDGYERHPETFALAKKHGVQIAFSSISFEFWILLHFEYTSRAFENSGAVISHMNRKAYFPKGYSKNDRKIYDYVKDRTEEAADHAEKIRDHHEKVNAGKKRYDLNPWTNADILVNRIRNLKTGQKISCITTKG